MRVKRINTGKRRAPALRDPAPDHIIHACAQIRDEIVDALNANLRAVPSKAQMNNLRLLLADVRGGAKVMDELTHWVSAPDYRVRAGSIEQTLRVMMLVLAGGAFPAKPMAEIPERLSTRADEVVEAAIQRSARARRRSTSKLEAVRDLLTKRMSFAHRAEKVREILGLD